MSIYYLSANGDDYNTGTVSTAPIKTFNRLNVLLQAGDTVYVAPGTYPLGTYGRFAPKNDANGSTYTIIGDKSGSVFGVASGSVIMDGQLDTTVSNQSAINLPTTWYGKLVIKNIEFQNWRLPTGASYGGVINVQYTNTTNPVKIELEDCVLHGGGQFSGNDGSIVYMPFNHVDSYFKATRTRFRQGMSFNLNVSAFCFTSSLNGTTPTLLANAPLQAIFNDCTFEDAPDLTSTGNWFNNNRVFTSSAAGTGFNAVLKHSFYGCTFKVNTNHSRLFSFAYGNIEHNYENCLLDIDSFLSDKAGNAIPTKITFKDCQVDVLSAISNSYDGVTIILDGTQLTLECNNTASNALIGTAGVLIINRSLVTVKPGVNGLLLLTAGNAHCSFKDSVFVNFQTIDCASTSSRLFENCMFSNVGSSATSGSQSVVFNNTTLTTVLSNSIVLKHTAPLMYISNTGGAILVSVKDNVVANTITQGVSGFQSAFNGNYTLPGGAITTRPRNMVNCIVPEKKNPLSGRQSAMIPVAGIGQGRFKILLEGGKLNTITLNMKKSWSGGKVEFYINNELVGVAQNVTTEQTVTLNYTPSANGLYNFDIFAVDGDTNHSTYTTLSYTPSTLLIDSLVATTA